MSATKRNILGVCVDAVTYAEAVKQIIDSAEEGRPLTVSALAVHGVMTGVLDPTQRYRLNHLDLVAPDGQPVRWALNWLYGTRLKDRVRGPTLMLKCCEAAAGRGIPVYIYGSRPEVLAALKPRLQHLFPALVIAGAEPSRFRSLSVGERADTIQRIRSSGAMLTFVGLGCPRQEVWAFEHREAIGTPIVAVGAAYDFHAGYLSSAPSYLQSLGLEWVYRLLQEPRRLWRRYLLLNPLFVAHLILQLTGLRCYDPADTTAPTADLSYG